MVVAYGVANLLQSIAAANTDLHKDFSPRLLWRLGKHKTYLFGIGFQFVAFALAFIARRDLPLFLVQSAVAAGLGVTAVLGVVVLKWRLPGTEVLLLALLCFGLAGLIVSAEPMPSRPMGSAGVALLVLALLVIAAAGFFAVRMHGAPGSVVLGSLAGLAFGAAAVASRPLASVHVLDGFFLADPLLYLLVGHSVVGQLLLGLAMQRGSTTAAVAAMDAAAAVPAAVIGLMFLGDSIHPGREWIAALGFVATLFAVIGLSFYAEPQHHHEVVAPPPVRAKVPVTR
jgi:drug/metabolite transporter (DMT)-like permease